MIWFMKNMAPALLLLGLSLPLSWADINPLRADDAEIYNAGAYGMRPNQSYRTEDFITPIFLINTWEEDAISTETHMIITAEMSEEQHATAMIFDSSDLSLVYADPALTWATDARIQVLNGTSYLTTWTGHNYRGWGSGGVMFLNQSYSQVYNVSTKGFESGADSHETQVVGNGESGTILLINYHPVSPFDLTSVGGPDNGTLQDNVFQEVNVETGEVLFQFNASATFDITESWNEYSEGDFGWDWFHLNAIQKTRDGDYLISVRHLCMLALINGTDGSRIWQVGGQNNMFVDLSGGNATNFCFQHDARFVDDESDMREITLFDNHAMALFEDVPGCTTNCSRGLRIELDHEEMTARVVTEFYHPVSVQSRAQGGFHLLPGGNSVQGWGTVPTITEFNEDGDIVMEVQTGPWSSTEDSGNNIYRAYKFNWTATPSWPPKMALDNGTAYVSWNGATGVASWALSGGGNVSSLNQLIEVTKSGFETVIDFNEQDSDISAAAMIRAEALDRDGNTLAYTDVISVSSGEVMEAGSVLAPEPVEPTATASVSPTDAPQPRETGGGDDDEESAGLHISGSYARVLIVTVGVSFIGLW